MARNIVGTVSATTPKTLKVAPGIITDNLMSNLTLMQSKKLNNLALILAAFTVFYNILEGFISTYLGFEDESLALFGFGVNSFIEVISGFGIIYMVLRIQNNPDSIRSKFERTALQITGIAFYTLVFSLIIISINNIWTGHRPIATFWGMIISLFSILVMWFLVQRKRNLGKKLNSKPILADANCTMVCVYMSIILLVSSSVYELFHLPHIDSVGTLGLAYFAFKEGKECLRQANANNEQYCNCD